MPSRPTHDAAAVRSRGGRPRDETRRTAILTAAGELMLEGGLAAATMEAIAARAGVSKQTIYNWWPSRGAVALEGFMLRADPWGRVPDDVSAADGLRILAVELVRLFRSPAGALMRSLIVEAQSQPEVADALRDQWLAPRRAATVALVERGITSGEFRADTDVAIAMDHVFAPIYYRLLLGHGPLTERFARDAVDQVLAGLQARE
ncbi:TetR-like C-terminal domain-containing protein [Jatrophihabitans sp. YIM 134969]